MRVLLLCLFSIWQTQVYCSVQDTIQNWQIQFGDSTHYFAGLFPDDLTLSISVAELYANSNIVVTYSPGCLWCYGTPRLAVLAENDTLVTYESAFVEQFGITFSAEAILAFHKGTGQTKFWFYYDDCNRIISKKEDAVLLVIITLIE